MKAWVLGRAWKISVVSPENFKHRFGEEHSGITLPDTCEIIFSDHDFTIQTVIHELVHAYYDGLCVSSANLKKDQVEEIFCEMFSCHGRQILSTASLVYRELKDDV